ncbi:divalent metal cation transporter [Halobacterium sp. R2-5]|uniref:NRAMP family divalent metal transporter n=1 Tax=Halobacterium sp. R2-5 TaxID=2715751 RepID=UPI00141F0038|nr:divalent metal cation transporter [Halobacterium sp. R2-5]NIC00890.1 divalent metal cation transporter [Halobacterium sp. R2-5]
MSNVQLTDNSFRYVRNLLRSYGMGLIFAANIFGAGSIYILSNVGVSFRFTLLWVLPLSLGVGLVVHEMSARLAVLDQPLMGYIRDVIGAPAAKAFAVFIAVIMHLWSVANYALTGAALAYLTPLDNVLIATILSGAAGIALIELRVYQRIETVIAVLVLAVFGSYLAIFLGIDVPAADVARGLVPTIRTDMEYLAMIMALVGTTIYYPNFFIQTSMNQAKDFDTLSQYRRDHTVGLIAAVLMSIAVLLVAAITVPSGVVSLVDPARPLVEELGPWALTVFIVGAGAASFSSATGTLFGAGFMVPQAFGHDTVFGDRLFRIVVNGLIVLSLLLTVPILAFTDFSAVQLALVVPAVNGVIGLPVTVLALYGAMHRYYNPTLTENVIFGGIVILTFLLALLTGKSLTELITTLV